MKEKHTVGPWTWRGLVGTGIEGPNAQCVAHVGLDGGSISKAEAQANAQLISASVELLEAATEAEAALYGAVALIGEIGNIPHAMKLLRRAINKASGAL